MEPYDRLISPQEEHIETALKDFAEARGRPALFLFLAEPLLRPHTLQLHELLAGRRFKQLDLVIHSGGGDIHSAYMLVELLRLHSDAFDACVPFWAKSAATLLCLGADGIVLGEHAELGPLDVQIYEEKKAGQGDFTSALNPFKTLEQLQGSAVEALASAMQFLVERYGLSYDEALPHAVQFVEVTTGPLISRLDPEKLGQYSRELSVAQEYGQRLLERYTEIPGEEAARLVERLVYGYPSHEYIIDYKELQALGFESVRLFEEDESQAAKNLLPVATEMKDVIELVEPASVGEEAAMLNGADAQDGITVEEASR